ncbi:blue copper protein-like protein [Carex littledalei]|uniref:Blue copper protein-like protein n=1 Tax=Carex littledalei TaxID=544730 RepID=A0A833UZ19_9POAL|nr:blue copper protein-like protein [Carex littledalei]
MYDPPTNITHPHSVYLMNNLRSYLACDLKKARMVGNVIQGGGSGFEFVLKKRKPHYFVCGERNGIHCTIGLMKFVITPRRPCRY